MPKVKITNLRPGACVINSLRLTIAGKGSVVRDASIIGDPDLTELEAEGLVKVESIPDVKPPDPVKPANVQPAKTEPKKGGKGGKGKKQPQQPQQPAKPREKPGTSFKVQDGPEDQMGGKVVVMGQDGPIVKHMTPGLNAEGPKFIGDEFDDAQGGEPEGFQDV